ncbi:MAG: 50S ribosomal protein L34e, partial [Candidatus Woesearchaeota archaeon]
KPGKAHCGDCGAVLLSIPRARAVEMHKIPPSSRRPQRPFPGLCPSCSRQRIIKLVKQNV